MHEKKGHNCPNFHNVLEKIINIENISNLPTSISKLSTSLEKYPYIIDICLQTINESKKIPTNCRDPFY